MCGHPVLPAPLMPPGNTGNGDAGHRAQRDEHPVPVTGPAGVAAPPRRYEQAFPATPSQVREARKFLAAALHNCPAAADAILCVSELASNSVLHSNSKELGGTFTVRAEVREASSLRLEVQDNGGPWEEPARHHGRPHGLDIIRALASECGRNGDARTGWIMWARLDWGSPAAPQQS